jgi:V/A-type H+/Na+-transporting ATPase subunit I
MTIARLQRVTLCGMSKDKDLFLVALQDAGCMHIVPLREVGPLEPANAGQFRRAYSAYRHLSEAPQQLRPWPRDRVVDIPAIVDAALKNKRRLREARDRRDFLVEQIERLQPFGDFTMPPEDLRGLKLWFYVLPVKNRAALRKVDLPWQIVGRNRTNLYLVLISPEEPPATLLPVPRTHTGSQPLSVLLAEREKVEIEIEEAEVERAELTRSFVVLGLRLTQAEELDDRRAAARMTRDVEPIFAVQGWVPVNDVGRIQSLAEKHGMAVLFEDPDPRDSPPTLLEDPGLFSGSRGLTTFYMTPSYHAARLHPVTRRFRGRHSHEPYC